LTAKILIFVLDISYNRSLDFCLLNDKSSQGRLRECQIDRNIGGIGWISKAKHLEIFPAKLDYLK
jgi:hypothetical protein